MKKKYTTYDDAIKQYNIYFGKIPTFNEITNLYHKYRNEWKHFDGFTDWLVYHTD
ncbi:hypothetical protein AGMMS49975_16550 [Clostridia bacterium]|nr:hypothetical protein AGMMS49975_16550 [Clostridia bacterium]